MRTTKSLALATALSLATPVAACGGGWGCGRGFWTGVGVVGGLVGLAIVADALTRPDVAYVTPPPAYVPPPDDVEARERDAYLAGWEAGRAAALDEEPYYPPAPVRTPGR